GSSERARLTSLGLVNRHAPRLSKAGAGRGFCTDTATRNHEYTLTSVHRRGSQLYFVWRYRYRKRKRVSGPPQNRDRKSTRLNSSHVSISYAVFCLKKKKKSDK